MHIIHHSLFHKLTIWMPLYNDTTYLQSSTFYTNVNVLYILKVLYIIFIETIYLFYISGLGQIQKKDCKYKYINFSIGKYRYKYKYRLLLEGKYKYRYTESKYKYKYKCIQLEPQTAIRDNVRQKNGLHYFVISTSKWPRLGFFQTKPIFFQYSG